MALKKLSPSSKRSAQGGTPASPRAAAPKSGSGGSMTSVLAICGIIAALIAIFCLCNKRNTEQRNEVAKQAEQNKRIEAENKARAAEHKKQLEDAKAAKKAKMEQAAKAAEEAARAAQTQQGDGDPDTSHPDGADTVEPGDMDGADPEPEPSSGVEDTDESAEDDGAEDETDTEPAATGELDLSAAGDADPDNAKRLMALARQAAESGDYEGLAATLKEKLEAAHPEAMKADKGKLPAAITKTRTAESARCLYLGVSLAMADTENVSGDEQKAFMKWLVAAKQKPAITFGKYLVRFKITEWDDAVGMMSELRQAYKDEPKKAFSKIKGITNPLDHNVSKKLYPHSKKDIATTIAKLKSAKQKGTASAEQREAVNLVNVYRYLSGLPADVVYDATYEKEANEAASACKAAGHIAHDLGHHTNQCNLFAGIAGPPMQTVSGYMADNGENNRKVRGHRAWILYPGTGKTAFGKDGSYQAMRTMDGTSKHRPKTAWSYPGRGFYPVDYLHGKGWSYYCAPGTAMPDSEDKVKVEMWSVPRMLKSAPAPSRLNKGSAIPILNTYVHIGSYMPTGNTIVFEPDYDKMKQNKGKLTGTYWIRISWPGYKDEYVVEFF